MSPTTTPTTVDATSRNGDAGPLRCLTVPEAAQRLAISRAKLYELLGDGSINSFTIGRSRRITVTAIAEFVASRTADRGSSL